MKIIKISIVLFIGLLFSGCSTHLPTTSSINDFVVMGTKTNNVESVSFQYASSIVDGSTKPFERDRAAEVSGHPGFDHTQSSTLGRMLKEFMGNKFSKLSPNGTTSIKATLQDFWVEQYLSDGNTGNVVLKALAGRAVNMICLTKIKVKLVVNKNGKESSKVITGTSEDTYVTSKAAGASADVNSGKNSIEHTHARNINKANNKVIMMMNSYFEEIGM
ncbi:MAG: hypothetical protein GY936_10735 [Ignavibacteriae bacterium]|nr:hypothetical protein [Ignavibacteriota bacterium]